MRIAGPSGAVLTAKRRFEYQAAASDGRKFLPQPILRFVVDHEIEMNVFTTFVETVVLPGETVHVVGTVVESERLEPRPEGHSSPSRPALTVGRDGNEDLSIAVGHRRRYERSQFIGGYARVILGGGLVLAGIVDLLSTAWSFVSTLVTPS